MKSLDEIVNEIEAETINMIGKPREEEIKEYIKLWEEKKYEMEK